MSEPGAALLVAALLFALLAAEVRLVPALRPALAFRLTAPLPAALAALPRAPAGRGRAEGIAWEVAPDGVRFWAVPGERAAPMGLRGLLVTAPGPRGVGLRLRAAPPFALLGTGLWLAGLGLARGDGPFSVPLGLGLAGFVGWWYARAARRAAAGVRSALARLP